MSDTTRPRPREDSCELEPVTCWPVILGAGGSLLLGVVFAGVLFAYDCLRPAEPVADNPAPPKKQAEVHLAAAIDRGPDPPAVAPAEPPRSPPSRRVVVREYVPLPPAKPREKVDLDLDEARLPRKARAIEKPVRLARKPKAEVNLVASTASPLPRPLDLNATALEQLLQKQARELDLEGTKGESKKLLDAAKEHLEKLQKSQKEDEGSKSLSTPLEALLASRDDLAGLPLLAGNACRMGKEQAAVLAKVSASYRTLLAKAARNERSRSHSHGDSASLQTQIELGYVDPGLKKYLGDCFESVKQKPLLVGPLEQTYQAESAGLRVELVATLAKVEGKQATQAIARRAVYDLSPAVREAAVKALEGRKLADAREVFLSAFRHPWPAAADHAALALVALEDQGAMADLAPLLDLPDPSLPVKDNDRWLSKELVRVNHLRNCLLCHAPSVDAKDTLRAPVPTPGERLPDEGYLDRRRDSKTPAIRADVVYFRQDFSVMHAVEKPNKWPAIQRFDYLVQSRALDAKEAQKRLEKAKAQKTYPQREALRWAVAMLKKDQLERID